ncbi:hypothetical protein JR316_0002655 [Psilocybe cubensis]|uniref:Uncharacterized protein n=2 Tax=Psilocybe cubensis TaxID=181762 RepID=A0ACB8HCL0_PSICU|nr:hypothetical protein JR316_0002655 [Psilocybe cubensis]KAH9485740.1 hypothetical protein JR316_0002655 [Psilocybe cubensis]
MIYHGNETPKNHNKSPIPSQNNQAGASSQHPPPPPPSYENYRDYPQPQHQPYLHPRPHVVSVDSALLYPQNEYRQSPGRRFLRAFLVAGLIWLLLTAFFQSLHLMVRRSRHGGWLDSWDYSIPPQVNLDTCVQGAKWTEVPNPVPGEYYRLAAETSFELPLSSETLFLLSRGDRLGGAVKVKTSNDQAKDTALVNVLIRYRLPIVAERTKACLVNKGNNENGVGLFAPVYHGGSPGTEYQVSFEITVTLPEHAASNPLDIKNFETDVHNSRHDFADLGAKVLFETITVKGTNGRIETKSLTARRGYIQTTNGGIAGKFSTNETLRLVTSNGRITADVNLECESTEVRPKLQASTTNGRIDSNINLISKLGGGQGGAFDVSTTTTNSQLDVKFPKSPVDSTLDFTASTTNSRARVTLNPAYEGTFDLRTSSFTKLNIDRYQGEDPAGKNRKRLVTYTQERKNQAKGYVSWDPENAHRGSVVVSTTNSALYARI